VLEHRGGSVHAIDLEDGLAAFGIAVLEHLVLRCSVGPRYLRAPAPSRAHFRRAAASRRVRPPMAG
jgi:hypothetical protein